MRHSRRLAAPQRTSDRLQAADLPFLSNEIAAMADDCQQIERG
jgi:hypothetical protein